MAIDKLTRGMTLSDIDLGYKQHAKRVFYDIEVLKQVFTVVLLSAGEARVIVAPATDQVCPTEAQITRAIRARLDTDAGRSVVGEQYDVIVHLIDVDSECSVAGELRPLLKRIIICEDLSCDNARFTEYYGWNSARYDLTMLAAALVMCSTNSPRQLHFTPQNLRIVSDAIIKHDGPPWALLSFIETYSQHGISASALKQTLRLAGIADGHIDLAAIARAQDEDDEARFPPGLKREMARYGLDIVVDELVAGNTSDTLTLEQMLELISYNVNDVIGTACVSRNGVVKYSIVTRDMVRDMYKFTSAKAADYRIDPLSNRIIGYRQGKPAARDCTAAELAGRVLIGPGYDRPVDYDCVDYTFPVPVAAGSNETANRDLLEYMKQQERFMPEDLYTFFAHFRGKDTRNSYDDWRVKKSQPITHSATMNIPYYRDNAPLDCYIRVSTGGAHGSVMAGLRQYTPTEVHDWTRADAGASDHQKPTLDISNAIHIDWSSFYPTMASKMRLYESGAGVDRYTQIIKRRFEIKRQIKHDKSKWTQHDVDLFNEERGLKFILNNATGAGNMHSKYALLPVDNKTLSMRLIGNMLIWCLGQRLAQAGAFIVSTNTDGLFITGISLQDTTRVIDKYVSTYGMPVEPELTERFINRDTSNRIEYAGGKPATIGGLLRCGMTLRHEDYMIGRTTPMPIVVAHAALEYMRDPNWLYTPYDRNRLHKILCDIQATSTVEPWYHIYVGNTGRVLVLDGVKQQKVTRLVLTTSGARASVLNQRRLVKATACTLLDALKGVKLASHRQALLDWADRHQLNIATPIPEHMLLTVADTGYTGPDSLDAADELAIANPALHDAITAGTLARGTSLYVVDTDAGTAQQLKLWYESDKLTRYPSSIVTSLPTVESLARFDMRKLDIDAYTDWSEQVLLSWKKTADLPQLGLKYFDDPALKSAATQPRLTRRDKALRRLNEIYTQLCV